MVWHLFNKFKIPNQLIDRFLHPHGIKEQTFRTMPTSEKCHRPSKAHISPHQSLPRYEILARQNEDSRNWKRERLPADIVLTLILRFLPASKART